MVSVHVHVRRCSLRACSRLCSLPSAFLFADATLPCYEASIPLVARPVDLYMYDATLPCCEASIPLVARPVDYMYAKIIL